MLPLTSECSPRCLEAEAALAQPHPARKSPPAPNQPSRTPHQCLGQCCQHSRVAPGITIFGKFLILLAIGKFHSKDMLSFLERMQILEKYCNILGKWGKLIYLWKYFFWYKSLGEWKRRKEKSLFTCSIVILPILQKARVGSSLLLTTEFCLKFWKNIVM